MLLLCSISSVTVQQLGISLTLTGCMILPKPVSLSWPQLLLLYNGCDGVRLIISQSVVNRTIASNLPLPPHSPTHTQFLEIHNVCQLIQGLNTERALWTCPNPLSPKLPGPHSRLTSVNIHCASALWIVPELIFKSLLELKFFFTSMVPPL